jgi:hypothetical protein
VLPICKRKKDFNWHSCQHLVEYIVLIYEDEKDKIPDPEAIMLLKINHLEQTLTLKPIDVLKYHMQMYESGKWRRQWEI